MATDLDAIATIFGGAMAKVVGGLTEALNPLKAATDQYQAALQTANRATEDYDIACKRAAIAQQEAADAAKKAAATGLDADKLSAQKAALSASVASTSANRKGEDAAALGKKADDSAPSGLAGIAGVLGGAMSAVTGAVGMITEVIGKLQGFVQALSPQTVAAFSRSMQDLQATIGVAVLPVFQMLTGVLRQVAGELLPVMQQFTPIVAQLANTWASNLIPVVQLLVGILDALVPVFEVLAVVNEALSAVMRPFYVMLQIVATELGFMFKLLQIVLMPVTEALKVLSLLMDGYAEIIRVVTIIFKAMTDTMVGFIKSLFGGLGVGKIMDFLTKAIMKVIEALLVFVVTLAKMFGADKFVANLIDGLKEKKGAVAAGEFSYKGFEQVGKDLALASAQASGAGQEQKKFDLGDVVKRLEEINASQNPLLEALKPLADMKVKLEGIWDTVTHPLKNLDEATHNAANRVRSFQDAHPVADALTGGPLRRRLGASI